MSILDKIENDMITMGLKPSEFMEYLQDVAEYGCESGAVSSMINYEDTITFFQENKLEINSILADCGESPENFRGFDKQDILCLGPNNQNIIAWFAYEYVCMRLLETLQQNLGRNLA